MAVGERERDKFILGAFADKDFSVSIRTAHRL
jgi:hypothetical protein